MNRKLFVRRLLTQYARLEAAAAKRGLTVGEWCREELLHAAGDALADGNGHATVAPVIPMAAPIGKPADETLLAEVLALRTILLNLFYDLANGETVSTTRMQELIAKADGEKREKALARLKSHLSEGAA